MNKQLTPDQIQFLRDTGVPQLIEIASQGENQWLLKLITADPYMLELKEDIRKLMYEDDPVLIIGESGTGKELIANALHDSKEGLFIAINCAGLPEQLIESELFGHMKGSFTGAIADKKGMFEEAADGTIFLDEIGDMPLNLQTKLLRAIQERKIRRVGANTDTKISVRLVCATHKHIDKEDSAFRRDLYHRISAFTLRPTPLRNRVEDIPLILESLDTQKKLPKELEIGRIPVDGNVRSLQHFVRRYYVLGKLEYEK